jgi:hypothetical protein
MESSRIIYTLHGEAAIADGYTFGTDVIYIKDPTRPLSRYSDWQLRTRKVDHRIANFSYSDFRLGQAVGLIVSQWDWRGSQMELIPYGTLKKLGQLRKELRLDKSQRDLENELYLELKAEQKAGKVRAKKAASGQLDLVPPAGNILRLGANPPGTPK